MVCMNSETFYLIGGCGFVFDVNGISSLKETIEDAKKDADAKLPPGAYYEIREKYIDPLVGGDMQVAWYCNNGTVRQEVDEIEEPEGRATYIYHGTFRT